jgi:hypothetical protein
MVSFVMLRLCVKQPINASTVWSKPLNRGGGAM